MYSAYINLISLKAAGAELHLSWQVAGNLSNGVGVM